MVFGLRLGGYIPVHGGPRAAQGLISGRLAAPVWTPGLKPEEPAGLVMTSLPGLAWVWVRREGHPLQARSWAGAEQMAEPVSGQAEVRPFPAQKGVV